MDAYTKQHLATWLENEFRDETEREEVCKLLTDLWESDIEYWESHSHSWWEMLDIGRRNREMRAQRALKAICKS